MNKLISAALALFLCMNFNVNAQDDLSTATGDFVQDFTEALRLMEEGYIGKSVKIWDKLAATNPDNANVNYKTGYCHLLQNNNRKDALPFLEKAVALQTDKNGKFKKSNYDPIAPREKNAPVEAIYYLGEAYLLNYKLEEAKNAFTAAADEMGSRHRLADDANRGIEMTDNAQYQLDNARTDIGDITNLGDVINGQYNDYSPVLSADENALFYTSRRLRKDSSNTNLYDARDLEYYEDIYVSYKDRNGKWQEPELLNINIASEHSATVNVSPNGQRLFIYKGNVGGGDLFESKIIGTNWVEPTAMSSQVNSKSWETHTALSADQQTLYFVSDQGGGEGKRDIYRCVVLPNGEWSKALNLGPTINTKYDEDAVYIHPDGKTLYFASKGHSSMGGFDIFKSVLNDEGTWSEPENIGYPLNTVEDDVFFVTSADGKRAYFSSSREGGHGHKDIYMVNLPTPSVDESPRLTLLKGYVTPPAGETLPENVMIFITDKETGEEKSYKPRATDGAFVAILPPCKDYNIRYMRGVEELHSEDITVECDMAYTELQREVMLSPVNIGGGEVVEVKDNNFSGSDAVNGTDETGTGDGSGTGTDGTTVAEGEEMLAVYQQHFGYNEKDLQTKAQEFEKFMADLKNIVDVKGKATIILEGSASRVPTKTWKTNKRLSQKRADDAKETIMSKASEYGIDTSKLDFVSTEGIVQGPKYKYDFEANRLVYEQYQYVKMIAKQK